MATGSQALRLKNANKDGAAPARLEPVHGSRFSGPGGGCDREAGERFWLSASIIVALSLEGLILFVAFRPDRRMPPTGVSPSSISLEIVTEGKEAGSAVHAPATGGPAASMRTHRPTRRFVPHPAPVKIQPASPTPFGKNVRLARKAAGHSNPLPATKAGRIGPTLGALGSGAAGKSRPIAFGTNPVPVYPLDARKRKEEGTVVLLVSVDARGIPESVLIEKSSSHAALDRSAREAVLHWTFRPANEKGVPVASRTRIEIRFRLTKE